MTSARWSAGSRTSYGTGATHPTTRPAAGVLGILRDPIRSATEALDQLLVLGTLLEGHADYVMDAVGPAVVPSVHQIRRRFDCRRQRKHPPLQRLLRALLGVDAKLSQYTRGRAFVDHVVDRVGGSGSTSSGPVRTACPSPRRSRNRSSGSTGCSRPALKQPGVRWSAQRRSGFLRPSRGVALSGGPDSLALTAAAAGVLPTTALIIDHGLQSGSDQVAATARRQALDLGCTEARVLRVDVGTAGGPEAAARTARYAALDTARNGAPVLLAHTLDDQAETVLLGLGRGSGPRSIAGMRICDPPWYRPLLGVRRRATHAVCAELGLAAWDDPHNSDPRFTRVRLRTEVLPLLEEVLGGGVAEALARTAAALREDNDLLDAMAEQALARLGERLEVGALRDLAAPVRRRVLRRWLLVGGAQGVERPAD